MTQPSFPPQQWRQPLRQANTEPAPWPYRALARVVNVIVSALVKRIWRGQEHVPKAGALVVVNHLSNFDVLAVGEYLVWNGRWPRFLGKSEIWRVPVIGWLARQCQQIPVERNSQRAKDSLVHAKAALEQGECVAIFPEGTITGDPEGWPMVGRLGAARLALTTGVPVVPVAVVGSDALLGRKYLEFHRLFSLRRRPVMVLAGAPVDLSPYPVGEDPQRADLDAATERIMDALTDLVARMRDEPAPSQRWDLRVNGRVPRRFAD